VLLACLLAGLAGSRADDTPEDSARNLQFFETRVRPLLAERCFGCHGDQKAKGGLRLDGLRSILSGGESGPAVVPGQPDASLLIDAVRYRSFEMPPDRQLSPEEVQVLVEWVQRGAVFPGSDSGGPLAPRRPGFEITEADRQFWSFKPVARPDVPNSPDFTWDDLSPIDGFILHRLLQADLSPSPPASKRELIRRAFFDLTGLPPSPEETARFMADSSPDAFERLVDDLLARPQYGEKWARHWLDLVRFAQTNGYERDDEKPMVWRYRDWVVQSLNEDQPYDRFVREQLAGDELPDATHDSVIATGFYRLGVWDDEPDDKTAAQFDALDDVVVTAGETFLGLTIGCARCHDHKFDPIPQADYYRLLAFVRNITPYGRDKSSTHWELNPDAVFTPLVTAASLAAWKERRKQIESELAELRPRLETADEQQKKGLTQQIAELERQHSSPPGERALSVREPGTPVPETRILIRGSHLTPGELVEPAFLTVLRPLNSDSEPPLPSQDDSQNTSPLRELLGQAGVTPTSGRRLMLADWITSPTNPLMARVLVNRLWQQHFGQGLVSTPNDFGRTGQPPSHPELLDWLADEFVTGGWKLKRMHRLILLSRSWQQSSRQSVNYPAAGRPICPSPAPASTAMKGLDPPALETEPPPSGCRSDPRCDSGGQRSIESGSRGARLLSEALRGGPFIAVEAGAGLGQIGRPAALTPQSLHFCQADAGRSHDGSA